MKNKLQSFFGKSHSVKGKLWIYYIIAFSIPLLFLVTAGYLWIANLMTDKTEEYYRKLVSETSAKVEEEFKRLTSLADVFRTTYWVQTLVDMNGDSIDPDRMGAFELNRFYQEINSFKRSYSNVDLLGIYFIKKNYVISSSGNSDFLYFINNTMHVENMEQSDWDSLISQLNVNEYTLVSNNAVTHFGNSSKGVIFLEKIQPVYSSYAGCILIGYIKNSAITGELQSLTQDNKGGLSITDSGNTIISTDAEQGKDYLEVTVDSEFSGWKYTLKVPKKSFLRELTMVRNLIAAIVVVLYLLCLLIAGIFSRKIYKPINDLASMLCDAQMRASDKNEFVQIHEGISSVFQIKEKLEQIIDSQRPVLIAFYINRLFSADGEVRDFARSELNKLGIFLAKKYYNVLFLTRKTHSCVIVDPAPLTQMDSILTRLNTEDIEAFSCREKDTVCLVVNYNHEAALSDYIVSLLEIIPEAVIAIGKQTESRDELPVSYEKALYIKNFRYVAEGHRVVRYSDDPRYSLKYYYPYECEFRLTSYVSSGNAEEALSLFSELLTDNRKRGTSEIGINNFLLNIAVTLIRFSQDVNNKVSFRLKSIQELLEMKEDDLKEYDILAIRSISEFLHSETGIQQMLMKEVIEFVDASITYSDLSLKMVSQKFHVSASLISRMFKEKGYINFHRYVNERRISLSKSLLGDNSSSVLAVARQVGYDNDVTFRRLFKQYTGVTPSGFRTNMLGGSFSPLNGKETNC